MEFPKLVTKWSERECGGGEGGELGENVGLFKGCRGKGQKGGPEDIAPGSS